METPRAACLPLKRSKAAAVVVDTACAWLRAAQSDADADDDGTETETPLSSQFAGAAVLQWLCHRSSQRLGLH
jgi:hypothetical protein